MKRRVVPRQRPRRSQIILRKRFLGRGVEELEGREGAMMASGVRGEDSSAERWRVCEKDLSWDLSCDGAEEMREIRIAGLRLSRRDVDGIANRADRRHTCAARGPATSIFEICLPLSFPHSEDRRTQM